MNTTELARFVKRHGVAVLRADKTNDSPEIDDLLRRLGNEAAAIPFYAVFPASRPNRPITLDGVFTSPQPLIDALKRAIEAEPSG